MEHYDRCDGCGNLVYHSVIKNGITTDSTLKLVMDGKKKLMLCLYCREGLKIKNTKLSNKNAVDLIIEIMKKRNWHEGKIERRKASNYKKRAGEGELSYDKSCEILDILGWEKIKEETWEKSNKYIIN